MVNKISLNATLPGGFMAGPNQRSPDIHPEVIERSRANIPLGDFGQRRLALQPRRPW